MTKCQDPAEDPSHAETLVTMIATRADLHASKPIFEDARSGRTVTYRQLHIAVSEWSRRLDAVGAGPGAVVVVDVPDPLTFAVVFIAVIASGRCALPVDPRAPIGELLRVLLGVRPVVVVGTRPELAVVCDALFISPTAEPVRSGPISLARRGSVLLSTSGSTGEPKAVPLTEQQLLHVAGAVVRHHRLTDQDRGYNCLPLFHINGEVVALLATLTAGGCLVLDQRFHASGFWELLASKRITWLNAVPAILSVLSGDLTGHESACTELRFIRSASAPLPSLVRKRITAASGVPIVESYGMTEAASQITATPLDGPTPLGSCGRPVGVQLEIRDQNGAVLPPEQIGRVHIRGAGVISGYRGGRARDRFDAQGWLDTGDLGRVDAAGFLYLTGRSDDVINRGGELLYPREIEEVLLADPGVRDVVVVGRSDPVLGCVPVAFVVSTLPQRDGGMALAQQLHDHCARQLTSFKRPAEIRFVDDFPRAATGKVRRHVLRSQAHDAVGT